MKKLTALLLALVMILSCATAGAETVKHEHVYVVAGADGTVNTLIDSVRLENAGGLDVLTDRTSLTGIENVSGHETFTLDGETLTWQADGSSIRYQGTGTKAPAVVPVVTCTVDGKEVSAAEVSSLTGRLTVTVTYRTGSDAPVLAASVMLVPDGASNVELENAYLLDEGTRQIVIGVAVPGADESLNLPSSFTVTCDADHADFSWMMSAATSDPLTLIADMAGDKVDTDKADALISDAEAILTAMQNGEELPAVDSDLQSVVSMLNGLLDGAAQLSSGASQVNDGAAALSSGAAQVNDGAASLSSGAAQVNDGAASLSSGASTLNDGAASLSSGAATLNDGAAALSSGAAQVSTGAASLQTGAEQLQTGLTTLTASNDTLNDGASQIFSAILAAANTQIAASGLAEQGITVPELTADNYAAVLDQVIAALQAAVDGAQDTARAQVTQAVEAQDEAIRSAVTEAVQAKVLTAVLSAAGLDMTAGDYAAAVKAGKIPAATKQQISAAVDQQMASDEVRAQLEAAVTGQKNALIEQNLASDDVQAQIQAAVAPASAGIETLTALKAQLDSVNAFVTGLSAYTAGVAQAAAGADTLKAGTDTLADGAQQVADGAASLASGTQSLNDGAASLAAGAQSLADGAASLASGTQSLADGASTLASGTQSLADGASTLASGTQSLADGAASLDTGLRSGLTDAAGKVLPYVRDDLAKALGIFEQTRDSLGTAGGYDLAADGTEIRTVYIIRTDMNK